MLCSAGLYSIAHPLVKNNERLISTSSLMVVIFDRGGTNIKIVCQPFVLISSTLFYQNMFSRFDDTIYFTFWEYEYC